MFFKKKKKEVKVFELSEEAINFIKTYLLKECNITTKIDRDTLDQFVVVASNWESGMVDENGNDITYDYPDKEKNEMADRFVSEVSGKLASDYWTVDFDELNKKLGLK